MDIDTLNLIAKENRREQEEINARKNQILRMTRGKQEAWNELFPKLALKGLAPDQLEEINNTVY